MRRHEAGHDQVADVVHVGAAVVDDIPPRVAVLAHHLNRTNKFNKIEFNEIEIDLKMN